ncbi:MAG TPA: BTAD domain-containing putative transcriptional regulator [Actinophytocola sp.]|uniref:BTAD domain-containing putative transcriptional regulator n=1 Tax=Actinophytocola sp. TaxID=1872138 RepID=UPI002DBB7AFD|nr:BTAD domain-containing putative transcriptional regulator [Actinophytocola sp.]HEU5473774.1 BTAD domain-containing putative transcriptional regulator [Actinophytocola sp.]
MIASLMVAMTFLALGRVRLSADGVEARLRGRRERAVLALLLAARGQVLTADRLIEDIWGDDAGDSTLGSLQVAVSRLRALIEPDRVKGAEPAVLVTSGAGYALLAPPDSVDLEQFTALVVDADAALAAGRPDQAVKLCDEATALWAGPPFGQELDCALIRSETARLEDLRLRAHELRAQALLELGRHGLLTGELESLVLAHPFRERLWELLALALYRSGRQGDALATLRRARGALADELGIDPSPALRKLEADVLAQSPELTARAVPETAPASAATRPFAPAASGFIGRASVVADLQAGLRRVLAGHGETVLVSGDAGIGKTRLVTELAAMAAAAGVRVLRGQCHEADFSPAYWPWLPILRELGPVRPGSPVDLLLSPADTPSGGEAGSVELRTYDAVSALLACGASDGPLLVVIDDLQWADMSSLRLLSYAAEALTDERVMIIATLRDPAETSPALQTCLGALGRLQITRIALRGLPAEDVRSLVAALGGGETDDELGSIMSERTDGNPFFVIELVRLLAAEQRLHAAGARDVPVPHGIQDVLRLRLAGLSASTGRLLRVAAVIGREFDLDVAGEVSGTPPEEAIDLLDEAVRSPCVEEGERPGRYRFTHALVRETLLGSMSSTRRGLLHAAVAVALEARLRHAPELVTAIAHHFALGAAIRPELAGRAVRYAVAAARLAESQGALDEALKHWESAKAAEARTPEPHPRRRYDVLLGLGRARYRRGQVAGSREALDAAVDLGRELDDIVLVAEAASSFRGAGVWRWREAGADDPGTVAVLREAAAALPPGPLLARVLASLSMEMTHEWCSPEAAAIAGQAVDMARPIGDTALFADVVAMRMMVLWGKPGAAGERLALAAEVLRLPLSPEQELYARFGAAAAQLQHGEPLAADREMIRCTELARRLRHTGADVPIAWWRFYRAVATGDDALVARMSDEVIQRHRRSQTVALPEIASMAQLERAGADAPVPESLLTLATGNANPAFRSFIAEALARTGRLREAITVLGEPVPEGLWHYSSMYAECLRVDVLAMAGPSPRLRKALDRIEPWRDEFAVAGSTDYLGSVEYFIGRGREALGDLDGARAAYQRAVDRNQAAQVVPWLRRAQQSLDALPA